MRYKYISIYELQGILFKNIDESVLTFSNSGLTATIANTIDSYCLDIDTSNSVSSITLGSNPYDNMKLPFEDKFKLILKDEQERRRKNYGTGPYVVFEGTGFDASKKLKTPKEYNQFILCIADNQLDDDQLYSIKESYQDKTHGVLTALFISIDTFYKIRKVGDAIVHYNNDNKPIYTLSFHLSGDAFTSRLCTNEDIENIITSSTALIDNKEFKTINKIIAKSIDSRNDKLLSFLSGWTALEIFINKTFSLYKELGYLREDIASSNNLKEQFAAICKQLSPNTADENERVFRRIHKLRNDLVHRNDFDLKKLPVAETQSLLRELIQLHLKVIQRG